MPDHNLIDTESRFLSQGRPVDSPWLWLLITAGSVLVHVVLLQCVNAEILQARLGSGTEAVVPVDFVDLPASDSGKSQPVKPIPEKPAPGKQPAAEPELPNLVKSPGAGVGLAAIQPQKSIGSNQIQVAAPEPTDRASQGVSSNSVPSNSVPANQPDASEPDSPETEKLERDLNQAVNQQIVPSPEASAIPTPAESPAADRSHLNASSSPSPSPLVTTQVIDVPVPDVSRTLPAPTQRETDDNLLAVITNRITIPSHLTASVTADSESSEDSRHLLDKVAQPQPEVRTFSSNPTTSPCVVTPEAVQFLGKAVEMKVMTDAAGRVLRTVTQESSDSRAYDELATCLVKNWRFTPAIARGQAVADDGLVIRIVIDRG